MNTKSPGPDNPALVLFLSHSVELAECLGSALAVWGIALHAVPTMDDLIASLGTGGPAVEGRSSSLLLVDSAALSDPADLGALAWSLHARKGPPLDVVYLAPATDVRYRLAALRAEVTDCLNADIGPLQLAEQLAARLDAAETQSARILIVDDQAVAALFAARVLEAAGMQTERIADPLAVLEAVERFAPHLVLMDLRMPGATGIELTAIIRGQERFADLPIVFLSGEMDPHRQLDALRVGGDDFLAKPVAPSRLVDAVRARLKRSRQTAHRAPQEGRLDPQTGLATRELLLKTVDRQIQSGQVADWAVIYLEFPDHSGIAHAAPEVHALLEPGDLAARAEENGIAVLTRRAGDPVPTALAESLARTLHRGSSSGMNDFGVGWCPLSSSGGDAVTLVSRARKAARASLLDGKGQPGGYTTETQVSAQESCRAPIVAAIQADRLQILYQPMVALRGEMTERYESTPRLHTPDGELLPPSSIGSVALGAGLTQKVDAWMMAAGLDALKTCRSQGRTVELFIHQSLASAADDGWIDRLRDAIAARDLIRLRPVIQIQLEDASQHLELAVLRTRQLERLGIHLCLNGLADDEKYAMVLDILPAAYVRLASTVLQDLPLGQLKDLVARAQARGAQVIATGVDGPRAIERIYPARIDLIQGPYVQPPTETMDFAFLGSEALES